MDIKLIEFPYKYMEYERNLLLREVNIKFPGAVIENNKDFILLKGVDKSQISQLKYLSYIEKYVIDGTPYLTRQGELEISAGEEGILKRQRTRYSTHGIHEYKGKYNPQIVEGIINILGVDSTARILDPFCGSGTTMLECAHYGMSSIGTDINPMAVFISNAKIRALELDVNYVKNLINTICDSRIEIMHVPENARTEYLRKWLPNEVFLILEYILQVSSNESDEVSDFLKVTASNLIREYSNQEPSDLRIRRRIAPFPDVPFLEAWKEFALKQLNEIESIEKIPGINIKNNFAIQHDIREKTINFGQNTFDAIVTSPPYATALPYIDTQRISLVWLGLSDPDEVTKLESSLIGSREFIANQKAIWSEECIGNKCNLPDEVYELIMKLNNSIGKEDGFRRRAVPPLLYRYFADMKKTFINTKPLLRKGGHFALVVGNNKTTLGGIKYTIDTPYLLSVVANSVGWKVEELFPLQTYKRYGINRKNAINSETLLILTNE